MCCKRVQRTYSGIEDIQGDAGDEYDLEKRSVCPRALYVYTEPFAETDEAENVQDVGV